MKKKYDVIVVGGGHAGVEAACASARIGAQTALISHKKDKIGEMSCNPAIGGLGKGHLVREIDALDGVMGLAIDDSGIQFRMLNMSRGPAVRGPRAQADRDLYKNSIQKIIKNQKNLTIIEDSVEDLIIRDNRVYGVLTENTGEIFSESMVLTTGTFLRGLIRIGTKNYPAGRSGDKPSVNLAKTIESLGFSIGRLKTGTPPRILKKSINFNELQKQLGDKIPKPFSFINKNIHIKQIPCYITYTNKISHKIVGDNIHLSPMYSGQIESMGARYCPSIEDKIKKFASKTQHQIFLEPEGLNSEIIYPNGISTSLPEDVQASFVHSIKGLENAHILKPGYAIEYDYVNPLEIKHSLETKKIKNLFFAGQINGTTGYEEAAAQGLVAGINAAIKLTSRSSFIVDRSEGYIGVLIDDLVTKGTKEPYRMFTSRSEYRLTLRADNADQRLTPKGIFLGLVSDHRKNTFNDKSEKLFKINSRMSKLKITPSKASKYSIKIAKDGISRDANEILSQKGVDMNKIREIWPEIPVFTKEIDSQIEINSHYRGYLKKQKADILAFKRDENLIIPNKINYDTLSGLSNEVKAKFKQVKPHTMGQALRIDGITPAAVYILLSHVKRRSIKHIA